MKIAVYGVGGVGGYFGGRLAQAGEDVVFMARGQTLNALRTKGLRVDSINGDFVITNAQCTNAPSDVGIVDLVLVAVKAWQVPEIAKAMHPMVGPETMILPLQNGVEAPGQLADSLGEKHVLGGLCGIGSSIVEPGHIRHIAADPYITLGELDHRRSKRAEQLVDLLSRAQIKAEVSESIHIALWVKFLFIVPLGAIGAITRMPLGVWRSVAETRQMADRAMEEMLAIAAVKGIGLPVDAKNSTFANYDRLPAFGTSSLQRDLMEGRPSELENQIGAVVRFGQELNIPTPLHEFIYHSLLPSERKARGEIDG